MHRAERQLTPSDQIHAGEWLIAELAPFSALTVASLLPARFAAYARILHPAGLRREAAVQPVRWAVVAAASGRSVHAAVNWDLISDTAVDTAPPWDHEPDSGSLPVAEAAVLADVLQRHTRTGDRCWFGVWDGFGGLAPYVGNVLDVPCRSMRLLVGPVDAATTSLITGPGHQSANLWWPEDRSWCVATDIDLRSTFIGGSQSCIQEILSHPALEAWSVRPSQRIAGDADDLNTSSSPAAEGTPC